MALTGLSFIATLVTAQTIGSSEYQVKSVFLFHFAQFIEWPASSFASENSPFVIGVLGNDPFNSYLEETVVGEKINERPFVIKRFKDIHTLEHCHILFINSSEKDVLQQLLEDPRLTTTLTVADFSGFAAQGGMMGFQTENSKIKIQINLEETKKAGLKVSSKLLRIAEVVSTEKK